jgi:AraC-like DNA-binding protein
MTSRLNATTTAARIQRRPPVLTADPRWASTVLSRVYCPSEVCPLESAAEFTLSMSVVDLGPLTLGRLGYGSDVSLVAGSDRDCYIVTMPLSGQMVAQRGGRQMLTTPERGAVFDPVRTAGFAYWPAGCSQLALRIERHALEQWLQDRLDVPVVSPVRFQFGLTLTRGAGQAWLDAIRILATELEQPGGPARQPLMAAEVQHLIINGLLTCQPHNYSETLRRSGPLPRPQAVRVVTDLIKNEPAHPWTIPQLAAAAGVGVRALENGFRRYVGASPQAYLRNCRLHCAHEELRRSSPAEVSVTGVAHRWGFAHLGRFAQAYRTSYGCTPSATLRQVDGGAPIGAPVFGTTAR